LPPATPAPKPLREDLPYGILPLLSHLFGKCTTILPRI
jgi:hypothetical protein